MKLNPSKAPPVQFASDGQKEVITRNEGLTWFLAVPVAIIGLTIAMGQVNIVGTQSTIVDSFTDSGESASLRTRVSEDCAASMIELHGTEAWEAALAEEAAIADAGGVTQARELSPEERAVLVLERADNAAPIGTGIAITAVLFGLMLAFARGVTPSSDPKMLWVGTAGVLLMLLVDILFITPLTSPGATTVLIAVPLIITFIGLRTAARYLSGNEILRVVFPPLVLIIASRRPTKWSSPCASRRTRSPDHTAMPPSFENGGAGLKRSAVRSPSCQ